MPGIEEPMVTPINSLGQPLSPVIEPAATPAFAVQAMQAINANREAAFQATQESSPVAIAKQRAELQQAREFTSPASVQARQAQVSLARAAANKQQADLNGAEAEAAYNRYNANPLLGKDGQVDHIATREAGMNYLRAEWRLQYAQKRLTPLAPVPTNVNGQSVNVYKNAFGENPFDPDVQKDALASQHESMSVLFGQPKTTSWATPGDLVQPNKNNAPASSSYIPNFSPAPDLSPGGKITPGAPVSSVEVAPESIHPTMVQPPTNQPVLPPKAAAVITPLPRSGGPSAFDPQAAVNAWRAQSGATVAPMVIPSPVGPPGDQGESALIPYSPGEPTHTTTVSTDAAGKPVIQVKPSAVPVQPAANALPMLQTPLGAGVSTGLYAPGYSPPEQVKELKSSPIYAEWAHQIPPIGSFRSAVRGYQTLPKGTATTGNDLELANALIRMQNPAGNTKGASEYKVDRLEDAAPWLEKLPEAAHLLLRTEAYGLKTRQRLIAAGNRLAESYEGPARAAVSQTARQLAALPGINPNTYIGAEMGLLGLSQNGAPTPGGERKPLGPPIDLGGKRGPLTMYQ